MAIFTVSSAAELMAAASKAAGGDTILLAPGTYSSVSLRGININGQVTITSADKTKPVEINGLAVNGSSGFTFSNLVLADKDASTLYDFSVKQSKNINFDSVLVKGPDGATGYNAAPFMVRDSSNITITNSEFTHARYGLSMLDNNGVTLSGNYFHDIRTDGIRGGGNSNIKIVSNFFTDFRPAAGDHADAIQFWTTNTTTSAQNITIKDNGFVRGDGAAIQGIFMRDEVGNLPYKNVVIDGNLIVGGLYHGISVTNATDLTVSGNSVAGFTDQKSWISVPSGATLTNNKAELIIYAGQIQQSVPGNELIKPVYDQGGALINAWLSEHPEAREALGYLAPTSEQMIALASFATTASTTPPPVTTINGTAGDDKLKAAVVGDSVLLGGQGNDILTGGDGHTRMEGGTGNDIYYVNSTRDLVVERAGEGTDTVYTSIDYTLTDNVETLRVTTANLTVHGNALDNRMVGSDGVDVIYGEDGNDSLQGLGGNDILVGGAGNDNLSGGDGSDVLDGGDGNDSLNGGIGEDWLYGGAGSDTLEGGAGDDILSGGSGADMFQFRNDSLGFQDVITDFNRVEGDRIGLSMIDANQLTATDDAFRFIGTAAFSNRAGELRYSVSQEGALVEGDVNGDGVADFSVMLQGVTQLTARDFIL